MTEKMVLIHGAGIVTMDADLRIFLDGGLVIKGSQILAIGQSGPILSEFSSQADELLDLKGHWILPGAGESANEAKSKIAVVIFAPTLSEIVSMVPWLLSWRSVFSNLINLKQETQLGIVSGWPRLTSFMRRGLINTHVHTSQQLARGIADDVDLLTWLHHRIWPYESNMTEEDSYISTLLCGIELIHSGVTCFAEAGGQHVPGMARAVEKLGIRACLARSTMDAGEGLPAGWAAETTEMCMKVQEDLFARFNGSAGDRIHIWFGLRQILNATDNLLLQTKESAAKCNTGIHMHVAEISFENEWVSQTRRVDHGTVTFLNQIGLLDKNLLAAHSVWVNESEVEMMAQTGVKVSHCPAAAMRMLGFAPIAEMLSAGICVSIGTDGAPSNNRMSLVDEMYVASLINKGKVVFEQGTTDPTALPAETILKMATINGAKSVLWDHKIGSLEPGKKADLVVVDPEKWTMLPLHDPISSIVYCMRTENISSVMCDGQWIMREHKILTVDEMDVIAKAKSAAKDLIFRAGIQLPKRHNIIV